MNLSPPAKAFTLVMVMALQPALGYDVPTHFDLSVAAVNASGLANSDVLRRFGLPYAADATTQTFPSTAGTDSRDFETRCGHERSLTVTELIACGSQFEDVPVYRSLNHFFDPAHGGLPLMLSSPLGPFKPGDRIGKPNLPSPNWSLKDNNEEPEQSFSYKDARDYFLKALTLKAKADRSEHWGRTFQSIGQVIHHLQDMAQPQHVRNDAHLDVRIAGQSLGDLPFTSPSRFERYTADEIRGIRVAVEALASGPDANPIYPIHANEFRTPRAFFANGGLGIAEYTNTNFVSYGTNFRMDGGIATAASGFASPIPLPSGEDWTMSRLLSDANAAPTDGMMRVCKYDLDNCVMTFFGTTVDDRLAQTSAPNSRASTFSLFDQDLERFGATIQNQDVYGNLYSTKKVFSLNRFNFDSAYPFLIPHAVAYSSGLINYFFRGDIDLVYDEQSKGYLIENDGDEPLQGTFGLYWDAKDGTRTQITTWALSILPHEKAPVTIVFPDWNTVAAPEKRDHYLLVFNGDMGEEKKSSLGWDAVTARYVDLSPFIVFRGVAGSEFSGTEINMIVPERYESRIRSVAHTRIGDVVLTVNGQDYPAESVNPAGLASCPGNAVCDRIQGRLGLLGGWEFILHRNNEFTSMLGGVIQPIVATEDLSNFYQAPTASFVQICGYMNAIEASGFQLLVSRTSLPAVSTFALSLRDPADGTLRQLFSFTSRDLGLVNGTMFDTDIMLSAMNNVRIDQENAPLSDGQWIPRRLACRVAQE